jgi:putative flippase GtrA
MGVAEHARQFTLFLASGGIAAACNWGSRFFFSKFMPFEAAVTVAYLVGMAVAFTLMRMVFAGTGRAVVPQVGRFALVNVAAFAQTFIVSVAMVRWILPALGVDEHREAIGHFFGVATPAISSYFGHRFFTFK